MKPKHVALLAALVVFGMLSACSGTASVDWSAVEATLTTNPEVVKAGEQVELQASFNGAEITEKDRVTLDFRINDSPQLIDAVYLGDGRFGGTFTFPEQGSYDVYIHLYAGDMHLMKKKTVEVN